MERFPAASALIGAWKPDRPVIGLRPHAAGRAARWFLQHFPGDVAYAYKANSSVFLLGTLYGAGIRKFDVASIPEIEDAATSPAQLHHAPSKSHMTNGNTSGGGGGGGGFFFFFFRFSLVLLSEIPELASFLQKLPTTILLTRSGG